MRIDSKGLLLPRWRGKNDLVGLDLCLSRDPAEAGTRQRSAAKPTNSNDESMIKSRNFNSMHIFFIMSFASFLQGLYKGIIAAPKRSDITSGMKC